MEIASIRRLALAAPKGHCIKVNPSISNAVKRVSVKARTRTARRPNRSNAASLWKMVQRFLPPTADKRPAIQGMIIRRATSQAKR